MASIYKTGNVVKDKSTYKEMVINRVEIPQNPFNKLAHKFVHTNENLTDAEEESIYTYICFVEDQNGVPEKREFKYEDLTFVRSA